MSTETPAAYAAALSRLHACGVGDGVPKYLYPNEGHYYCCGFDPWLDRSVRARYEPDAILRILRDTLWEVLRGWCNPTTGFHFCWCDMGISVYRILDSEDLCNGATLLQAADAVCEWVEREPTH